MNNRTKVRIDLESSRIYDDTYSSIEKPLIILPPNPDKLAAVIGREYKLIGAVDTRGGAFIVFPCRDIGRAARDSCYSRIRTHRSVCHSMSVEYICPYMNDVAYPRIYNFIIPRILGCATAATAAATATTTTTVVVGFDC